MKPPLQDLLKDIQFHPQAQDLAKQYIHEFQLALFTEAITVAGKDKYILRTHLEDACKTAYEKKSRQGIQKQWANTFGGLCLGAAVPGFITELSNRNDVLMIIYILLGLIGTALLTWSFKR